MEKQDKIETKETNRKLAGTLPLIIFIVAIIASIIIMKFVLDYFQGR